jgi:DNA-binding NarL/FixJ family response regulator
MSNVIAMPIQTSAHDAITRLRYEHKRLLADADAGADLRRVRGASLLGVGSAAVRVAIRRLLLPAREVLAMFPEISLDTCLASHRTDGLLVARGVKMRTIVDPRGATTEALEYLERNANGEDIRLGSVPMQLKVVDRRAVVVSGPVVDEQSTALLCQRPALVAAAIEVFEEVYRGGSEPSLAHPGWSRLTERQRAVASLMAHSLKDPEIAAELGISLRTVRSDVARMMSMMGAADRFGLGMRLGYMGLMPSEGQADEDEGRTAAT